MLSLSQETEVIFVNDFNFISRLQEEQKLQYSTNKNNKNIDNEELILKVREMIKVIGNNSTIRSRLKNSIHNLYVKILSKSRKRQRPETIGGTAVSFTGV